jgi:hypothetical protein
MSSGGGGGGRGCMLMVKLFLSTIREIKLTLVINFIHQISLIKKLHVSVRCVKLEI